LHRYNLFFSKQRGYIFQRTCRIQLIDNSEILLSNLGQVVIKLAELRNLYGTGHGKEKVKKGLNERHARLAVGAGITLSTFLLETFEYRRPK